MSRQITGYKAEVWWLLIRAKRNVSSLIFPNAFHLASSDSLSAAMGLVVETIHDKKTRDEYRSKSVNVARCQRQKKNSCSHLVIVPSKRQTYYSATYWRFGVRFLTSVALQVVLHVTLLGILLGIKLPLLKKLKNFKNLYRNLYNTIYI